jgi:hypothetical protein
MSRVLVIPTQFGRRFKRVDAATFAAAKAASDVTIDGVTYTGLKVRYQNSSMIQILHWGVKPATPITTPDPPPPPPVEDPAPEPPCDGE